MRRVVPGQSSKKGVKRVMDSKIKTTHKKRAMITDDII
jgi:hypothetical protein